MDSNDDFSGAGDYVRPTLVESTCPKTSGITAQTYRKYPFVRYRESRSIDESAFFVFTDGSSRGSFAAVIVRGAEAAATVGGFEPPTHTRNVGAELKGARLGLQSVPEGSKVVLVSDYLGVGAWMTGNWQARDPEVREITRQMRSIIEVRRLDVIYVHHRGHQKPRDIHDLFTRYNAAADEHCTKLAKEFGEPAKESSGE